MSTNHLEGQVPQSLLNCVWKKSVQLLLNFCSQLTFCKLYLHLPELLLKISTSEFFVYSLFVSSSL